VSLSRRGFTLAELLVALTLSALLAGIAAAILAGATARLRERSERMSSEHALRVAAAALRAGLESLDSTGDLAAIGAQGFTARVTRAAGVLCDASVTALVARAGTAWWHALREPVEGRDSLLAGSRELPEWRRFALLAAPRAARCPDGSDGLALPVAADSGTLAGLGSGSPLRVIEGHELRLYRSAGEDWLGVRLLAGAAPIQPLAGPLLPAGLTLEYLRRDGAPALLPAEVASVRIRVSGGTDSLALFVALPR